MKNRKKNGSNVLRFEVSGRVWFGNRHFYVSLEKSNSVRNKREENAKTEFFKKAWDRCKINEIQSPSLLLQKYSPIVEAKIFDHRRNSEKTWYNLKKECIGGDIKKVFLKQIVYEFRSSKFLEIGLKQLIEERIQSQIESLKEQGYISLLSGFPLKTSSRLVVGLGTGHVLETSLTLHHIFGIPYIPGTSLKGVCRMVSFWKIAEKQGIKDENSIENLQKQLYDTEISKSDSGEVLKHKLFFGTQGFKGLLVFLDAFPLIPSSGQIFDLDIMNVHYQGYYTQNQPPGDWENPIPIVFLTVREGITFYFNVLFDVFRVKEMNRILKDFSDNEAGKIKSYLTNENDLRKDVQSLIQRALTEFGVGSKTRLGYGLFE